MTSAPADLLAFRTDARNITGLGAADVGIVGDGAHQRTGGFHEGLDVLKAIGRYHGPASANVGSSIEDYSARQLRDRKGLSNYASATDVGDDWPKGGRAAWLRFNNLLYQEMRDRPGNLPALRAINVSLDGKSKRRYDQLHRSDGLISSTDSVTTHTHLEFWRDTEGRRQQTLNRIVQLLRAAVTGGTPESASTGDDDMGNSWTEPLGQGTWSADQQRTTALAFAWERAHVAAENTEKLLAAAAADEVRDKATTAAIEGLAAALKAGGGSVEAAPIIDAVNAVRDEARREYAAAAERAAAQDSRIADLEEQLARAVAAAEANLSPAERAALPAT